MPALNPTRNPALEQAEKDLEQQKAEFAARGGKPQILPMGLSGHTQPKGGKGHPVQIVLRKK